MKTNKIFKAISAVTLLLATIAIFNSCTLEENPSEARLDPGTLNSEEALKSATAGMYRQFTLSMQWAHFWMRSYGGDDITTHSGKNKQGFRDADQMKMTSLTSGVGLGYTGPYNTIKEANNIIAVKENIIGGNKDNIDAMVGEAYFLRAFSYFHLARTFGNVPLITSTDIAGNIDLQRAELIDLYQQIESDFLMAESLLPVKYPNTPAAIRPNSGSARAFLAKLYMHWAGWPIKDNSKYALAASSAKSVIDNASLHGFALVPDMGTLWSITDENRFNKEMVFGLAHNQVLGNVYSNRHAGRVGYPGDVQGWAEVFAEIAFFNDFPDGPRKDKTYRTEVVFKNETIHWEDFKDERHPMFLKVTGYQDEIATNNSVTSMNTYCMRYADLLLYYAEAVGRSGASTADAWEALNMVRRRANDLPVNTPNATVDITSGDLAELAYTERKWELAGEFKRWDDLTRLERVAQALANRFTEELVGPIIGDATPENYFAEIPESELTKAPQLRN
ncbi:RagB/SusD family nutrient uptake outer membrane protein [Aestuariibaculum suncheonense]|uniref:RagB/SusD family nutrient uptake outer membrane protein n=1 Tax=Aestuariibaculum suncheonense TaxID=1028745 RepID=A0A8J6QH19_9FLAO|nr:RagB/SusD family nutrient uptake outer membrane protein [Aestuariibaculum suncheonense]MBD0835677.1 RagB/SusD family nutrient uptake outer membrane protein [Aestuariibaculum suncheonense]